METRNCVLQDQYNRIQGANLKVQNKTFSIYKGVNVIGRNKSAAVDLKHLNVSQYHAIIIIVDDTQHFISDLNSSNGTYLFGNKITPYKLYDLPNDTEIRFGDLTGLYLKMLNKNTTVHLETETIEPTQNFTQAFYGALTQLMVDDSMLNRTGPTLNRPTIETQDIHEATTQIVQYPPSIHSDEVEIDVENSSSTTEEIISDIHNDPTQIIIPQPSTSKSREESIHEAATQMVIFPQRTSGSCKSEENIHEIATQVVTYLPESIDSVEKKQEKNNITRDPNVTTLDNEKKTNISVHQESVIEDTLIEESMTEERPNEVKEKITQINSNENSNDSVDIISVNRPPDIEMQIHNTIHPSQSDNTSSTLGDSQDISRATKRKARKLSSSEDLSQPQNDNAIFSSDSETDAEEERTKQTDHKSSSSEDLLQPQHDKPICNSDSETDIEDIDVRKLQKKSSRKLSSSQSNTDTKASNESSEHNKEITQKLTNQAKVVNSDSETDIEDEGDQDNTLTQNDDVIKPKILSKKLRFNSDSETDVEDNKENEMVIQAPEEEDNVSMEILNETDCIPATQDAFANMFQYSSKSSNSQRNSGNVSSEESFKLGLTELMIDENEANIDLMNKRSQENNHNVNQLNDERISEEKMANSPQEISDENSSTKITDLSDSNEKQVETDVIEKQKINNTNLTDKGKENIPLVYLQDGEMKSCLITSKVLKKPEETSEETDVYLMPTQQISHTQPHAKSEDVLFMATKPIQSKDNLARVSGDTDREMEADEELYMMPTQMISDRQVLNNEQEDINRLQSIPSTSRSIHCDKDEDRDLYMMSTQVIKLPNPQKEENTVTASASKQIVNQEKEVDEDVYLMPTQKINEDKANFKPPQKFTFKKKTANLDGSLTTIFGNKPEDDPYSVDTQKIADNKYNINNKRSNSSREQIESHMEDDVYLQPTQEINIVDLRSKETEPVDDIYLAATQPINQDSLDKNIDVKEVTGEKIYVTETQTELFMSANKNHYAEARSPTHNKTDEFKTDVYDVPTQPLVHATENSVSLPVESTSVNELPQGDKKITHANKEESSLKRGADTFLDVPKMKRVKKSDIENLKRTIESNKIEDAETLSQIEAFVKKPFVSTNTASVEKLQENNDSAQESETLSQIEAFVKKPLEVVPTANKIKNKNVALFSGEDENRAETLSQIERFIKQPLVSKTQLSNIKSHNPSETDKVPIHCIPTIAKSGVGSKLETIVPSKNLNITLKSSLSKTIEEKEISDTLQPKDYKKNKTLIEESDDGEVDSHNDKSSKSNSNQSTIKNDIDQSFALLKAKSTRTRKSERVSNTSEIKVAVPKNRRSMITSSIAELTEGMGKKPATRRSRRVLNNNIEPTCTETKDQSQKSKKDIKITHKSECSDSDFSDTEIPAKVMKISATKKNKTNAISGKSDTKSAGSKDNREIKEPITPSTSKTRANARTNIANSEDTMRSKGESSTSNNRRPIILSRSTGRKTVSNIAENKDNSENKEPIIFGSKTRANKRTKTANSEDTKSSESESSASNNLPPITPSKRGTGRKTVSNIAESKGISENKEPITTFGLKTRAHERTNVANSEDTNSSESESSCSNNPPPKTPSRRGTGRKTIDNKSTPSTSKMRVGLRMKNMSDNSIESSCDGDSIGSNDFISATPSTRGRSNTVNDTNDTTLNMSDRSKRKLRPKVVFTMMDSPKLESLIRHLGGSIVDTVDSSTVLVTEHVKRSQKLLTAVGQGKPICSPDWIYASKKANEFLDPWDFILIDKEAESKWSFSLKDAITKATTEKLLINYTFQLMVSNASDVLKGAIEACGGKCVKTSPKNVDGFLVVVASPENRNKYLKIKKQSPGSTVVEPEAIFDGVLRQELRLGRHLLT